MLKQLEYKKLIDDSTGKVFRVARNGKWLCTVFFDIYTLTPLTYYIRFMLTDTKMTVSDLRNMKRMFRDLNASFVCQVQAGSRRDRRFAEFFGFKVITRVDERLHMEKN